HRDLGLKETTNPSGLPHRVDAPTDRPDPHPHTAGVIHEPYLSAWSWTVASQSARRSPSPASEANPPRVYESLAQTDRQSIPVVCVDTSAAHPRLTPYAPYCG